MDVLKYTLNKRVITNYFFDYWTSSSNLEDILNMFHVSIKCCSPL